MMESKVLDTRERPLMRRTDYTVRVFVKGVTPSRQHLVKRLARELKATEELLVIRRIRPVFGEPASIVEASLYENKEARARYESPYVERRHEGEPKEAPAAAPAGENTTGGAGPAEDTPTEGEAPAEAAPEGPKEKSPGEAGGESQEKGVTAPEQKEDA